jgi:two-component system, sensor histidine kinase LadS
MDFKYFSVSLLLLLLSMLAPANVAMIDSLNEDTRARFNISPLLNKIYFEDESLTESQIPDLELFNRPSELNLNDSIKAFANSDVIWLHFSLNSENYNQKIISFGRMGGDQRILLYVVKNQILTMMEEHSVSRHSDFDLSELSAGQHKFLVRAYDFQGRFNFPVEVMDINELATQNIEDLIFFGLVIGFVFGLALYNLIIFFKVKQRAYLYYVAYLFSVILIVIFLENLDALVSSNWLWLTIMPQISTALAGFFIITFLSTKQFSPRLHNILLFSSILSAAMGLLYLVWDYTPLVGYRTINFLLVFVVAFSAGIIRLRQGFSAAKYFLIGWPLPILGGSVLMFMAAGILPWSQYIGHWYYLGVLIEIILFALALADRINGLEKDKARLASEKLEISLQTNQLKDNFLATISHELRTPLNGTSAALELLALDFQESEALKIAQHSSKRLTQLIDKILIFSEVYAGKLSINRTLTKLSPVLEEKFEYFQLEANKKGITLSWKLELSKTDSYMCDADLIVLICSELMQNAISYSQKGDISIVCQYSHASGLYFSISDQGIGFDVSKLDANDYLQQLDTSFNRNVEGLGLGLSLVNLILKRLDGRLIMSSELNKGSCFEFYLPISEQKTVVENKNKALFGQGKVALIVEDQQINQVILTKFLQRFGFDVVIAHHGKQGVDKCQQQVFDLIFMDLQMPVMNGFDATYAIKNPKTSTNQNCDTPILAVSANSMSADQEKCLQAGMLALIKKPINLTEFEGYCLSALNESRG